MPIPGTSTQNLTRTQRHPGEAFYELGFLIFDKPATHTMSRFLSPGTMTILILAIVAGLVAAYAIRGLINADAS